MWLRSLKGDMSGLLQQSKRRRYIVGIAGVAGLSLFCIAWGFRIGKDKIFPYAQAQAFRRMLLSENREYQLRFSRRPYWDMRLEHFRQLRSKPKIVMLGDSITANGEWQEMFPDASIINRGIDGDTTVDILSRLDEVMARRPKAVFILVGFNDLFSGRSVETVINNYKQILADLSGGGTHIYIQSAILPGGNIPYGTRRAIAALNSELAGIAASSEYLIFIDLNERLATNGMLDPELTLDGVHLNGKGYSIWAEMIAPHISKYAPGKLM